MFLLTNLMDFICSFETRCGTSIARLRETPAIYHVLRPRAAASYQIDFYSFFFIAEGFTHFKWHYKSRIGWYLPNKKFFNTPALIIMRWKNCIFHLLRPIYHALLFMCCKFTPATLWRTAADEFSTSVLLIGNPVMAKKKKVKTFLNSRHAFRSHPTDVRFWPRSQAERESQERQIKE